MGVAICGIEIQNCRAFSFLFLPFDSQDTSCSPATVGEARGGLILRNLY